MKFIIQKMGVYKVYFGSLFIFLLLAVCLSAFKFYLPAASNNLGFWTNVFFINFTFLGDGFFCIALIAYLVWKGHRAIAFRLFFSVLITAFLIQFFNNCLAPGTNVIFFEPGQLIFTPLEFPNLVEFPSSHMALFISLATTIVLEKKSLLLQFIFLPFILLMAYSRIYLCQQQLIGIISGAAIGIFAACANFYMPAFIRFLYERAQKSEHAELVEILA